MKQFAEKIQNELKKLSDKKTKDTSQHFFKETIKCYGVKTALIHKLSKQIIKDLDIYDKKQIFKLCNILMESGYIEDSIVACNLSYSLRKTFEENDIKIFETWIKKYVNNWASCDTLCNHTVGAYIEMFPDKIFDLKSFAKSKNKWLKRAAAVSLIIPAKKGLFLKDIFEIADILLLDNEDLVQKGYGWMLKALSQSHQKEVYDYVILNKNKMPRTALRYAIEKMPKELKSICMTK